MMETGLYLSLWEQDKTKPTRAMETPSLNIYPPNIPEISKNAEDRIS